jgi:hypothetical protein
MRTSSAFDHGPADAGRNATSTAVKPATVTEISASVGRISSGCTGEILPPNGWPLSCGRAESYHDSIRRRPPARLKPAAVSFSGLLGGDHRLEGNVIGERMSVASGGIPVVALVF